MPNAHLSFRLPEEFIDRYASAPVDWGYPDAGGNSIGEITFLRTYSRVKDDGKKERWHEVCRRVIEGTFSILKDHCAERRIPWDDGHAFELASEAYERLFAMKWTPPGRGLWMMGTPYVHARRDSSALQNCGFVSTADISAEEADKPFTWLMHASMLGVGVGFDTLGAKKALPVHHALRSGETYHIEDSREGWVESTARVLRAYLSPDGLLDEFDYRAIRPSGAPIRGFGGTAAGADPLMALHAELGELLESYANAGRSLDSRLITDIANLIGKCVVAGNVRRSAEIALGEVGDEDFLSLKNYRDEKNGYRTGADGWSWVSNNSLFASLGMDYGPYLERTAADGEPGFFFLDLCREYGRMKDAPNGKDRRAAGTNPCSFAGEVLVMTTEGPRRIDSLAGRPFWALVNGEAYLSPKGAWVTGVDDIYTLRTDEGYNVNLTSNHKVMRADGSWCPAGDLVPGDSIQLHNHRPVPYWPGNGSEAEGYLAGLFLGDGSFQGNSKAPVAVIQVWKTDPGYEGIRDAALRYAESLPHRSDWHGWREYEDRDALAMSAGRWMAAYFSKGHKHIGDSIETAGSAFQAAFLRGLFDADGHIEGWQEDADKGLSVRLGQSHLGDLEAAQRMLLRFGIKSKIRTGRAEAERLMPDGHGGQKTYVSRQSWRLIISADDVSYFADRIGFLHSVKAEKLAKGLVNHRSYTKPFLATVQSLEFLRRDSVWDLTVSTKHAFDANGLYVSNSEQTLESYEMCTLVETYPTRCADMADWHRTLKFAYLYAKAVTLLPTVFPETNAVMQRNHRIGCSASGLAQFLEQRGWYELRTWLDKGYGVVCDWDRVYSEWLCVRESIKKTSIKPSGTVSLLAGVTPGVHFQVAGTMLRAIRLEKGSELARQLEAAGYRVEPAFGNAETTVVAYFPCQGVAQRTERDASIFEKAELAALAQGEWADNQVSVTVTFDPDTEAHQVGTVLRMYEGRLKSVSFLPMSNDTYPQMPYTSISEEAYEQIASSGQLRPLDWDALYDSGAMAPAIGEAFCTNDHCEVPLSK